jgi:hypothetical protein
MNPLLATDTYLSPELIKSVVQQGPFSIGILLGCGITMAIQYLSSGALRERNKLDFEREKELHKQLQLRDDKIDALHAQIALVTKKGK